MLTEIQQLVTTAATILGIGIAWNGLGTWKRELTGKRDIALCQSVIEKFYEAEERMSTLRSPMSFAGEAQTRAPRSLETEEQKLRRDNAFVPLARWSDQFEFWSGLLATKWQMRAVFGDKAVGPYDRIDAALRSFRAAASVRFNMIETEQTDNSELLREFERTIWEREDDGISSEMRTAIEEMEAICVPLVRARQPIRLGVRLAEIKAKVIPAKNNNVDGSGAAS